MRQMIRLLQLLWKQMCTDFNIVHLKIVCNRPTVVHYWEHCKHPIWGWPYFDPWLIFLVLFWGPISDSQVTKNYKNPTISRSITINVFIIFFIISYPNFSLRYVSQDSQSSQNWKNFGLHKTQKSCVNLSSPLKIIIKLCKIKPFKSLFWGVTILLKSVLCKKTL